jgi:peptidyl-tRNA hydrolase
VQKFILGKFKSDELDTLTSVGKSVTEALDVLLAQGLEHAMNHYN